MQPSIVKSLLAGSCLAAAAMAVTPVSDCDMNKLLSAGGVSLAMKAQPMWFFAQARNQKPCIPVSATQNGNQQTPSSKLCDWPDAGCDCVTPDKGIGNQSQSFPIYYSYQRCAEDSVRVAYNLFFQKDGFNPEGLFGHPYDWERVIVVWKRLEDSQWRPNEIYLSEHSGYLKKTWDQIQDTFDDCTASQPRGGPDDVKNKDHAKVYVAWSKHAIYDTRNTDFDDVISQLTDLAVRSNDWWYFATQNDYIRADRSTEIGALLGTYNWGEASSNPPSVHDGLCTA